MRRPILMLLLIAASPAFGDFSEKQTLNHFYNAELLDRHEMQVSIVGNLKFGVLDDLEIGGNALFLLLGAPNLALKHRMFEGAKFKTAFSSHIFMMTASNEAEEETADSSTSTNTVFFGGAGIVTSHEMAAGNLTWGLYDFLVFGKPPGVDIDLSAHFISPSVAYDLTLGKRFGMSFILAYPAYVHGSLNSEQVQAELNTSAIGNGYGQELMQAFATGTLSVGVFNVEFGLGRIIGLTFPYVNLFWRF